MPDFWPARYSDYPAGTLPCRERDQRYPPPHPPPMHHHHRDRDGAGEENEYRFESVRKSSFVNWPVTFLDPAKLAEAGFYYTHQGDKVQCFECKIQISEWVEGDDPKYDHQRWSERCRFVRNIPCGNVPIGTDPADVPPPAPRSRDVCGPYGFDVRPSSGPGCCSAASNFQHLRTSQLGSIGIGVPKEPAHPQYASKDARLRSFGLWPKSMKQTKEEMADAGFFYTGHGDQTLCFCCGKALKDWEAVDDPWEQHALWFSDCHYLLTVKGQAFVDQVKGYNRPEPSAQEIQKLDLPNFIQKVEQPVEATSEELCTSSVERRKSVDSTYGSQETEDKSTDDGRLCKICYTEELGVVFLPCGHMVACVKCAPGLTTCAICRKPFTMTVRAFIS